MAAYVEHQFKKGFLLDEERLRKLDSIISERLSSSDHEIEHSYKIFRADSYSYDTNNVDDIISEDNAYWQRIVKIEINTSEKDFKLKMLFANEGANISIVGDDRDRVYLLFSDIREYLKNEVCICRYLSKNVEKSLTAISMIIMLLCILGYMYYFIGNFDLIKEGKSEAVASNDVMVKLNYLINSRNSEKDMVELKKLRLPA